MSKFTVNGLNKLQCLNVVAIIVFASILSCEIDSNNPINPIGDSELPIIKYYLSNDNYTLINNLRDNVSSFYGNRTPSLTTTKDFYNSYETYKEKNIEFTTTGGEGYTEISETYKTSWTALVSIADISHTKFTTAITTLETEKVEAARLSENAYTPDSWSVLQTAINLPDRNYYGEIKSKGDAIKDALDKLENITPPSVTVNGEKINADGTLEINYNTSTAFVVMTENPNIIFDKNLTINLTGEKGSIISFKDIIDLKKSLEKCTTKLLTINTTNIDYDLDFENIFYREDNGYVVNNLPAGQYGNIKIESEDVIGAGNIPFILKNITIPKDTHVNVSGDFYVDTMTIDAQGTLSPKDDKWSSLSLKAIINPVTVKQVVDIYTALDIAGKPPLHGGKPSPTPKVDVTFYPSDNKISLLKWVEPYLETASLATNGTLEGVNLRGGFVDGAIQGKQILTDNTFNKGSVQQIDIDALLLIGGSNNIQNIEVLGDKTLNNNSGLYLERSFGFFGFVQFNGDVSGINNGGSINGVVVHKDEPFARGGEVNGLVQFSKITNPTTYDTGLTSEAMSTGTLDFTTFNKDDTVNIRLREHIYSIFTKDLETQESILGKIQAGGRVSQPRNGTEHTLPTLETTLEALNSGGTVPIPNPPSRSN